MKPENYQIFTLQERPDLLNSMDEIGGSGWPLFMVKDKIIVKHWNEVRKTYPKYQFILLDKKSRSPLAIGNSLPVNWDESSSQLPDGGVDWAVGTEFVGRNPGGELKNQIALQIVVSQKAQRKGISALMVKSMADIGRKNGLKNLYAPVRPTLKCKYPLILIDNYVNWKHTDSLPFDPWMRVHARLGAEIAKVCHKSLQIHGTVAEWEEWTKMYFPQTGSYIIPFALVPVEINREQNSGDYIEPNVWMQHSLQ